MVNGDLSTGWRVESRKKRLVMHWITNLYSRNSRCDGKRKRASALEIFKIDTRRFSRRGKRAKTVGTSSTCHLVIRGCNDVVRHCGRRQKTCFSVFLVFVRVNFVPYVIRTGLLSCRGVARFFQRGVHTVSKWGYSLDCHYGQDIVMAFSPPVPGCLVKKGL